MAWAFAAYAGAFALWALVGGGSERTRTLIADLAFLPVTPVAAVFAVFASRHHPLDPRRRRSWRWIAAAFLCWWTGDLLWSWFEVVRHVSPFPSLADACYLAFYPLLFVGALTALPRRPKLDTIRLLLDALTVSVVGGMLTWYFVVRPIQSAGAAPSLARALNIAYPSSDVLLVAVCAIVAVRGQRLRLDPSPGVLAIGAALFVGADIWFARLSLTGQYRVASGPDVMWMLALAVLLAAPVTDLGASPHTRTTPDTMEGAPRISVLPYLALVAEYVLLIEVALWGDRDAIVPLLIGSMIVTLLVAGGQVGALWRTAQLLAERHGYERVVAASGEAIITTDLDATVVSWNPAAERTFGWAAAEVLGASFLSFQPADQHAATRSLIAEARAGGAVAAREVVCVRRDGSPIVVALSLSPLHDASGRVAGLAAVAHDLTGERRMRTELADALALADASLAEARDAAESTQRFLENAAHQLRTPVTGIRACAETLLGGVGPVESERLLAGLGREAERAGRLIAGLLSLARVEGDPSLRFVPTDLGALVEEEASRFSATVPVEVVIDPPAGPVTLAPDAVREAVANLLDNAVRHARTRVDVGIARRDGMVTVRVRDDGSGLDGEVADLVFERFVSFDGGSGLGLAIARGVARAHGGDVRYEEGAFVMQLATNPIAGGAEASP